MMKQLKKEYNPLLNSQDWDILIVLDACRYENFYIQNIYPGALSPRESFSSCTGEWIQSVRGKDLSHIAYISANPLVSSQRMQSNKLNVKFKHFIDAWDIGWDEKIKSIHPETVTKLAVDYLKKNPGVKTVVHYIQPHHPFIGKTKIEELGYEQIRLREKGEDISKKVFEKLTIYQQVKDGTISYDHCMKAYQDNLKLALDSLEPLLEMPGKRIITADHGDCFGEDGIFAHPAGSRHPLLVTVPWFEAF